MHSDEQKAYDLIVELHSLAKQYEVAERPMRDSIENRMYEYSCALDLLPLPAVRKAQARFDQEWKQRLAASY